MKTINNNMKDFFNLFINRSDTYAIQTEHGYRRMEEPLTGTVIKNHLDGKKSVGAYQLSKNDTIKWLCFDFDGKDLDEQLQLAKRFFLMLRDDEHIKSLLLEFSGRKGYHVWIFCEEVDAASAKHWADNISRGCGVHEVFPKQSHIRDKYGNLVKLPLCVHQISKKRSFLFDTKTLKELSLEDGVELIKKTNKLDKLVIPKVIIKEIVRTVRVGGTKTEMPIFIKNTINAGVKEGNRHKWRFIITKELHNLGYKHEEIAEHIRVFNKNCNPPDDDTLVERHVYTLLEYPERYLAKEIEHDQIAPEELEKMSVVNYRTVMETYNRWLHLKDDKIIDAVLATAITRKLDDIPLWLIMIGSSGSGKTEIIRPLEDQHNPSTTEVMSRITRNTFLSGMKNEPDFAETLKNNPKLFLTFDFAQFTKLNSEEKGAIWAQLRDIYDGFIERKAAFMVQKKVTGIKVNWIICTTPVIDTELLVQQELGTRELLYRFRGEDMNEEDLMERVWLNAEKLKTMRKELHFMVRKFIEKKESEVFEYVEIGSNVKEALKGFAVFIAVLRADTESDRFTGELTNFVYKEMPTRVLLQLKLLFTALKNLDEKYPDTRALAVIRRIALSSIHPVRLRIILELIEKERLTTTNIQKALSIGWKTVNTQLYTAKQLGLVEYEEDEYEDERRGWKKKTWFVNADNPVIQFIEKMNRFEDTKIEDFLYGRGKKKKKGDE